MPVAFGVESASGSVCGRGWAKREGVMFARVFGLCVAFVAAVALMSASSAASAKAHGGATIDVSTRAAVVDYLRSIRIDPRGVVIERGLRNYVGARWPGRGWTCTTT